MKNARPASHSPGDALANAAQWFVLLASGEASEFDRMRWQRWRADDPINEQAWARVEAASAPFAGVPAASTPAAIKALTRRSRRSGRNLLSVVVVALIGLAGWRGYLSSDFSADAVTAIGELRALQLDDGSRLLLDTDTAIDIEFDGERRLLRLRRGRMHIVTGHDPAFARQPFVVVTARAETTALGTQFSVQQSDLHTRVAVTEARVAVLTTGDERFIVGRGGSVAINDNGTVVPASISRNDSAWQRGMLIADDMTLGEFLVELERYHDGELQWTPAVAQLRISGAFPLRDTEQLLVALAETLPVRIERDQRGRIRVIEK